MKHIVSILTIIFIMPVFLLTGFDNSPKNHPGLRAKLGHDINGFRTTDRTAPADRNNGYTSHVVPNKTMRPMTNEEWHLLSMTNPPPPRYYHAQVYDTKRHMITIFGGWHYDPGENSFTMYDDTWQGDLNTNSWQEIETDVHPSARASHAILDSVNNRILLFGGVAYTENNVYPYNDLWQFDLDSLKWRQLFPTGNLPESSGDGLILDPIGNRVLFFGGESIDPPYYTLNETWALELDGLQWIKLATTGTPPTGRVGHGTIYDPAAHRMIIFSGKYQDENIGDKFSDDLWALDLESLEWKEITCFAPFPEARAAMAMIYDHPNSRIIMFGGEKTDYSSLNDLWEYNLIYNKWNLLSPQGSVPKERAWMTGDFDNSRHRMLVFGGTNSFAEMLNDTYELALPEQTSHPGIILVPQDQPSIQAGIDAAAEGDLILVRDSTYYENINFMGKAITVASYYYIDGDTSHINNTVIEGSQPGNPDSGSVVSLISEEDTTSIICGFTITGGNGTETSYIWEETEYFCRAGGGIFLYNAGALILNNKIIDNTVYSSTEEVYGGGVAAFTLGSTAYVILEHNQILHNTITADLETAWGGGIEIFCDAKLLNNNISFNSVIFNGNNSFASSGGVDCLSLPSDRRMVIMEYNKITYNSVLSHSDVNGIAACSGGIGISGIQGRITNNEVSHNEIWVKSDKNGCGAGILISETPESFRIAGNIINENAVTNGKGWGGGINISNTASFVNNNIIAGNSATNGGGILTADNCSATFINNTIINNLATSGGGIYLGQRSLTNYLMNSIIWGNQATTNPAIDVQDGSIEVEYSDVQGGWAGTGNINEDPQVMDNKFYLSATSPCIDKGHPDESYNDPEDPNNPGFALLPAKGTVRNDMGAFGGHSGMTRKVILEVKYDYRYFDQPELNIGYVDSCAGFWLKSYDNMKGGFFTNVTRDGSPYEINKNTLTQSRNAYGLVRAFMMTGDTTYLNYADKALRFMYQHGWDAQYGGWFEQLDDNGNPTDPTADKTAFFQHYALLGIAAYYEATRDTFHLHWLEKGFQHLQDTFWDDRTGFEGYYDRVDYNGSDPSGKSFNATVDAITTHGLALYQMTGEENYLIHLRKLADQIINHLVLSMPAQKVGFAEMYDSDWQPDESDKITLMGHVLKTAWCLARIDQIDPESNYLEDAEMVFKNVLDHGYDNQYGGPYDAYDRTTGDIMIWTDTTKAWWQMEQAILGGLQLYNLSGDNSYKEIARESSGFFMANFVDREYGEIYANRDRYGQSTGSDNKGDPYKAGYHSIETGYYTYLYGMLFNDEHNQFELHYRIAPLDSNRRIPLMPVALRPDAWPDWAVNMVGVFKDGELYQNFSNDSMMLDLPAGTGGDFTVRFQVISGMEDLVTELPRSFKLDQNFPNPFNPRTVISWQLAVSSKVDLSIYNNLGQRVATLVSGKQPAGSYQIEWDASDFSSGIYFYQLRTDRDFVQTKKLILLK